ncbi:retrovirus-related pol polyprotein from transposon TNT 1-94 [Tanacetum coccineum]
MKHLHLKRLCLFTKRNDEMAGLNGIQTALANKNRDHEDVSQLVKPCQYRLDASLCEALRQLKARSFGIIRKEKISIEIRRLPEELLCDVIAVKYCTRKIWVRDYSTDGESNLKSLNTYNQKDPTLPSGVFIKPENLHTQYGPQLYDFLKKYRNQVVQKCSSNLGVSKFESEWGLGHLDRNCIVRPKRMDAAYLQTQLLIAQKEEAGIQLQAKDIDIGTQTDKAPVYDSDGSAEVHEYENFSSVEHNRGTVEQHPATVEETHTYFDSLYNNLETEVEKVNSTNRKMKETNAKLTTELARYKKQEKCFEINQEKYDKFESVGISHQSSFVRTPQQNGVVERRNQTLVEAAKTMLIFSCALLFLWDEAIATACYTKNRSIIHRRFDKTPYELINGRKLDISFLHVFGALCYPKNDCEDIRKLGAKGDIGFFIGYSANSCAYRVYNRRTKKIIETMNVTFDELSAMAFEQHSSKPRLQSMTSGHISSGLDLTYAPSTITSQKPTERELDLLFEVMYDDYIGGQPSAAPRPTPAAPTPQVLQTPMKSTTTTDTAPTPTNSSSQVANIPNTS